jgi:hypothetical protein
MARFLLVAAVLASASPGLAQTSAQPEPAEVHYKKRTFLELTAQDIEGKVKGPSGLRVQARGKPRFRNLIVLRRHFRPEMLDSANDL